LIGKLDGFRVEETGVGVVNGDVAVYPADDVEQRQAL
jgi:hypothetical protein